MRDENKPPLFPAESARYSERKADVGKLTTRYRVDGANPLPLLKLVAADCGKRGVGSRRATRRRGRGPRDARCCNEDRQQIADSRERNV